MIYIYDIGFLSKGCPVLVLGGSSHGHGRASILVDFGFIFILVVGRADGGWGALQEGNIFEVVNRQQQAISN